MTDCPSPTCVLAVTARVDDEQLGSIVEVRCQTHERVGYGGSATVAPPTQRIVRE